MQTRAPQKKVTYCIPIIMIMIIKLLNYFKL
jgi:hypothetical protein